jgi:predicted double-glycine peptidase
MTWLYLATNAAVMAMAGFLGWRSRRFGPRPLISLLAAASGLMALRTFLHLRPEYEQYLLRLSSDYVYFSAWEAQIAVLMAFALAGRLTGRRLRRAVAVALVLFGPLFLWDSVLPFFQPDYAMAARFDADQVCRQSTDYSCGPAAAVTMLKHYGAEMSEGEMARLCLLRPNEGVTVLELCRGLNLALRRVDRQALIERPELGDLPGLTRPFLAEVRRSPRAEHCVVVFDVRPELLVVGDPAYGKRVCSWDEFRHVWTGVVITAGPAVQTASLPDAGPSVLADTLSR